MGGLRHTWAINLPSRPDDLPYTSVDSLFLRLLGAPLSTAVPLLPSTTTAEIKMQRPLCHRDVQLLDQLVRLSPIDMYHGYSLSSVGL